MPGPDIGRLEIDSSVILLGHRDDVPDLAAAVDVHGYPAWWYGRSPAVLEAMAFGLPVLMTDAADPPAGQDVRRHGPVVAAGGRRALTGALDHLLDRPNSSLRAAGLHCRRLVVTHHDLAFHGDRFVDEVAPVLETTVVERATAPTRA